MKLEIEVPEITCCRCSAKAAMLPVALRRIAEGGTVVDSAGNGWQAQGAQMPAGWTVAPSDTTKTLCAACTAVVNAGLATLLQPPAPLAPVKSAATSIPTLAAPPVVGRVIGASPTPTQRQQHVSGGTTHYASQQSRPAHVVSASPVIVQPSAISRPIAPAAVLHAPQPSAVLVGPPKIHAPIAPAERGSHVSVASNTQFPQPKVTSAVPVPTRNEVQRSRELPTMGNDEVEPVQPPAVAAIIRGTGV
jgi:hypothetical protein